MSNAATLVGAISVVSRIETASGVLIKADIEDLATGRVVREQFTAPAAAVQWTAAEFDAWLRSAAIERMRQTQEREVNRAIAEFRAGRNPLRDAAGNPIGTDHMNYAEAAAAIYRRLQSSSSPEDRVLGARITQSLTDAELAAITGLDAAGVQQLRDQAAFALQADALMRQAGGMF